MPWYWTDDLARNLIDTGKADQAKVGEWLTSPVAIRRDTGEATDIAAALLDEEGEPPLLARAA